MNLKTFDRHQQDLNAARACAFQMSRTTDKVVEVRQVTAQGFIYCERGVTNEGQLVGAFRRGQMTH